MDHTYTAGVVGSRRRNNLNDRRIVLRLVEWLLTTRKHVSLASGGCPQGADAFAEEAARVLQPNVDITVFNIDKTGVSTRWDFTKRAYERNRLIAQNSDELFALVAEDRTGGTENTIKHALEFKTPVYLITTSGAVYLSSDGSLPTCDPVVRLLDSKSTA
jgi:hypothetical protein